VTIVEQSGEEIAQVQARLEDLEHARDRGGVLRVMPVGQIPAPAARGPPPRPSACGWECAPGGGARIHGVRAAGRRRAS
jgi:hypothetical protein